MHWILCGEIRHPLELPKMSQVLEIRVNEVSHIDYPNLLDFSLGVESLKLLLIIRITEVSIKLAEGSDEGGTRG